MYSGFTVEEMKEFFRNAKSLPDVRKKHKGESVICMKRKEIKSKSKPYMAYDLETTQIKAGTPEPLYITVFGENYKLSMPIKGKDKYECLCAILEDNLLIPEFNGMRYIAWNGNNYDVYFIAKALLLSDRWILRPYLTRTKQLRGMKIVENRKTKKDERKLQFEFLDGLSMTGLASSNMKKLEKFLEVFAPDYRKLTDAIDFNNEKFDANNPKHVEYAERDAEGLYYGIREANRIVKELTGAELQPTIGNLAIKYFQSRMPENVECWRAPDNLRDILYAQLKRGGYCWVQKQYHGPVWKYDLNQAYAAAMRDTTLPAGRCYRSEKYEEGKPGVYQVRISRNEESLIPFYYRTLEKNLGFFTCGASVETWITSTEYEHLKADGWNIEIFDGYAWQESFNMADMVNDLERLRFTDPQGPSGPLGTMVKMIGNNAYGKTLEQLEGLELIFAKEAPEGFISYMPEIPGMENVFCRIKEPFKRAYHQPQIGIFITAHVRILVREAALRAPEHFIYADTDCVVFSKPVDFLDIDARRYGAWKQEADGLDYIVIGKKIYTDGNNVKKAKGLSVKELTKEDYLDWLKGKLPVQKQIQKQNFVKFIGGADMFISNERKGTDVSLSQHARLVGNRFIPISI